MKNPTYFFKKSSRLHQKGDDAEASFWDKKAAQAKNAERRKMRMSARRAYYPQFKMDYLKAVQSLDVAVHSMSWNTQTRQSNVA